MCVISTKLENYYAEANTSYERFATQFRNHLYNERCYRFEPMLFYLAKDKFHHDISMSPFPPQMIGYNSRILLVPWFMSEEVLY